MPDYCRPSVGFGAYAQIILKNIERRRYPTFPFLEDQLLSLITGGGNIMAWGTYWGVDSASPANKSPNGGSQTLFEAVVSYFGTTPSFWGRYINGPYAMDSAEANYILNDNAVNILVLYVASHIADGYNGGTTDAHDAISTLETLQNNAGGQLECAIFVDIENGDLGGATESDLSGYLRGWADTIYSSVTYYPGFYYPTDCSNSAPYGCAYQQALSDSNVANAWLYSPHPEPGCSGPPGPSGPPDAPCCNGTEYGNARLAVWQYAESCCPCICYNPTTRLDNGPCVDLDEANTGVIFW